MATSNFKLFYNLTLSSAKFQFKQKVKKKIFQIFLVMFFYMLKVKFLMN